MADQHLAMSPERTAFRDRIRLRPVNDVEEGSNLVGLPEGVFGFSTSPGTEEIPVFSKPIFRCFEVWKPVGSDINIVGYLSDRDLQAFQSGMEPASVRLFPDPYDEATRMVAIPRSRIDRAKPPSRDSGNWITLDLAPKSEFRGVGSTAN